MRTTVTLDPDVAALLRERMQQQGQSFKQALNQALRAALAGGPRRSPGRFRLKTYGMGFRAELAMDKALHLADLVADGELEQKLGSRT